MEMMKGRASCRVIVCRVIIEYENGVVEREDEDEEKVSKWEIIKPLKKLDFLQYDQLFFLIELVAFPYLAPLHTYSFESSIRLLLLNGKYYCSKSFQIYQKIY